ncbi:MAG: hypothetical protein AAF236_09745 [Verrucomicrobiota bacterium]
MDVPETITCVDCGQPARLLSYQPEKGWRVGDYVAYRCTGCNDRWDLEVGDPEKTAEEAASFHSPLLDLLSARKPNRPSGRDD